MLSQLHLQYSSSSCAMWLGTLTVSVLLASVPGEVRSPDHPAPKVASLLMALSLAVIYGHSVPL